MNENGNGEKQTRVTGRDLEEHGLKMLDVTHYDQMPVDNMPVRGQISHVDWMKVADLGKLLAALQDGMPTHVRGKWGIGFRIAADAYQWGMSPTAIADQTYVVNNRLSYQSQLIHALINKFAPLMHRLKCEYRGTGGERVCICTGQFISGDEREYETPKFKDITPKNSPLWKTDPDQQQWYFAVRAWGRKWVPEVVLGLYTKEELEADKELGYERDAPGLHARLKGSAPSDEGHQIGHAAQELDQIEHPEQEAPPAPAKDAPRVKSASKQSTAPKQTKRSSELPKPGKKQPEKDTAKLPTSVTEYLLHAKRWIKTLDRVEIGQRWAEERKLRNQLGMTAEDREPLEAMMQKRLDE